ncbi:unnamed protein product [Medioppia subpectinata]|uniref:Uncharacterized protein n=1 Tax=Medioppia subpectinata TaxID=1979941 RepID=A0A7R9KXH3_9ACAR|nr:unnamed protein product [Medioppia subpectinata]CAG2110604.1 unnamed protein product [Medioppia subpectinata]
MDDSIDTKANAKDDSAVEKEVTDKAIEEPKDADESSAADASAAAAVEEPIPSGDDKDTTAADDKMDTDSQGVDGSAATADEPKSVAADEEPTVADETGGDSAGKGVEPSVGAEPVPEVAVKSPSPAPAVQSMTPPRSQSSKKPKVDLASVPVRQYLDTTVVPILLQGLSSLARERPQKPIAFLAQFLLEKASEYDE